MDATIREQPKQRTIPTLESLSASQIAAIRAIPPHDQSHPVQIEASRPTSIFLDAAHFAREQDTVFNALPVPITMSAVIPGPGELIAVDSYGKNIIVARGKDGVVRAFLNACTHKGSKLVEDGEPRSASRIICPYHAWTYALDGKLIGVPRAETFANLCKEDRPLAQLECAEKGGIIWVGLDRKRHYDFGGIDDQLVADLEALNIPRMHLYGRKSFDLKANWKLVLEPFLEGYHVQRLHSRTVGPLFADTPSKMTLLGRNIRQSSGRLDFTPDMLEATGENIHKLVTHAYQVFPNLVVVTSPYYISIMILAPRAADRTIVDYMMLTREAPDNPKAEELFLRSYEMILSVFGGEDFRAAQISQEGLSSGAMDNVLYSGLEENIPVFYDLLDKQMGV